MKRYPSDGFSIQGCNQLNGVYPPSKSRHGFLDDPLLGYDLCTTTRRVAASREARAAMRRDRLSLGQIDTVPDSGAPKAVKPLMFRIWKNASLGQTPGIPNLGHSSNAQQRNVGKRGKILRQSESSRRNLQSSLAKVRSGVDLYTMCLSLPGYVEHFTHSSVKMAFLRFLKRLTAKTSRDSRFREVAGFWKQELQKRNALHFHLLLSGVALVDLDFVHQWICGQWIDCVMLVPGMPPEMIADEKRKMLAVHLHAKNFEKIRGNFHAYFAKYLGKDVEAHAAEFPIPGRWWGKFNSAHLPFGQLKELPLPARVALHSQRVCRKIRQARANDAKHLALCRRFNGLLPDGKTPGVSRHQLQRFYQKFVELGGISAFLLDSPEYFSQLRRVAGSGTGYASVMFYSAIAVGYKLSDLVAGCKFPSVMKYSSVRLTGSHVPPMMVRILEWAGGRALIDRERTPF